MNPYSRRAETVKADSLLLLKEFQNILESLRGAKLLITGSTGMNGSYLGWLLRYLSDKLELLSGFLGKRQVPYCNLRFSTEAS